MKSFLRLSHLYVLDFQSFSLTGGNAIKKHLYACNFTGTFNGTDTLMEGYQSVGCHYHPNAFLMSCLLFIGTFLIAWHLKKFKAQSFFTNGVRGFISDFAVIIAIFSMTAVDIWANVRKIHTQK